MREFLIALGTLLTKISRLSLFIRGISPEENHSRRIVTGKTWDQFCDTLKASGHNIMRHSGLDERTAAEGYRYLSRLTRAGLEAFLEYADSAAPEFRRMVHETVKMGADNPDNFYQNAVISGEYEYRIRGKRGTVTFLTFSTQKSDFGQSGDMPPTGFLDSTDLVVDDDGSFEIMVGKDRREGNWLPMESDSSLLLVRQTFLDRATETPAELSIERADSDRSIRAPSPESVDKGLMKASNLVAGASFLFSRWAGDFKRHTNKLPRFDPDKSTSAGGDPQIAYYHSHWKLEKDEAMVIEAKPPECELWNFQLNNYWMESLDYRYFRIHVNKHTASYNDDGSVTVVVAHANPGHPNWLSTTGHQEGTMCWRWIRADETPAPSVRVVPFSHLGSICGS